MMKKEHKTPSYRLKDMCIFRVIEGEAAVVKPDDGTLIMLNETGTFILKNLKRKISLKSLLKKVLDEYDISEEKAIKDVHQFLSRLIKEGIIEEL